MALDHVIAQEVIIGDDNEQWVCNCFFDQNSNLVQAFTFNRLRLSPSHFGVTSYAVSKKNTEVITLSKELGKSIGYKGTAMIEFKHDQRDGKYKYIELNPRLGLCNFYDTSCGVNNVYYSYLLAQGLDLQKNEEMKEGVVFVSLYEDLFSRLKDGESIKNIVSDYLNNASKPHVFIYFVWWDPYPFIYQTAIQFRYILKAIFKKI